MKTAIIPADDALNLNDLQVKSIDYVILAYSNNKCIGLIYNESEYWYFSSSSNLEEASISGKIFSDISLTNLYNQLITHYDNVTIKYESTC